jgi:site-specific recombinase XerD
MGLDEAIAAYLAACEVEGKSPRTVDAYAETLTMFRGICLRKALPQRVGEFGPAHVYAFLKVIADSGVSLGTRHRRFRETRAFFSWCTRMGGCAASPFTGIANVKVEQKVIQPLSEAEIQALLDLCDPADEFGCRNRAIILLFLDTGMRYAELHQLTLADVSWEDRRIHIRYGKGRKQRVVPFGDGPEDALRAYIDGFRGENEGPLFLTISRWGEPRRPMNKYLLAPCSHGSASGPACTLTPIASGTLSPPGRSRTTPAKSTCSTCWATPRRRWCGATPRPTTRPRQRMPTRPSVQRRDSSPARILVTDLGPAERMNSGWTGRFACCLSGCPGRMFSEASGCRFRRVTVRRTIKRSLIRLR